MMAQVEPTFCPFCSHYFPNDWDDSLSKMPEKSFALSKEDVMRLLGLLHE